MAEKLTYVRVNWEDSPSENTPINSENLNKMDATIEAVVNLANRHSEQKVDKTSITLGTHTDGLIYIFVDGKPVGTGLSISGGGTVEPDIPTVTDDITLADGVMTILALANEPTLTDGVLYIS